MRRHGTSLVVALAVTCWSEPHARAQVAEKAPAAPTRASGVVELGADVLEPSVEAALGWMKFIAAGYRGAADHLGNGAAADAELALGDAIEKSLPACLQSLAGKKGKVRLNDAFEGPVSKVEEGGIVVTVNKFDTLVPWAEIDPAKLAVLVAKDKPTAEPALAAVATLRLLGGDAVDAKRQAGKLTGELGKKLQELVEAMKLVGPELAATRALDAILREKDAAKAFERFKAGWGAMKTTRLAGEIAAKAREQFVLRAEHAFGGDAALKSAVHGKVTTIPARAHPAAGPGGVGLEIEFEFEKDSEGPDFDPGQLDKTLLGLLKNVSGSGAAPVPFVVSQSRLVSEQTCGGELPVEFGGDVELEVQGGLLEQLSGNKLGFLGMGFATQDGAQVVLLQNYSAIDVFTDGKRGGPSMEKKLEKLGPGDSFGIVLKLANGKLTFTRNGEQFDPALKLTPSGMLRPFVVAANGCQWYVERVVVRGTATRSSLDGLAHAVAEKEAKALFGG